MTSLANESTPGARIFAVTVTYNSGDVLKAFLDCVTAQKNCDWGLIVVDNNSADSTPDILSHIDDPRITVILNAENTGFSAATNQGIKLALSRGADRIILLNNDTEFEPELFSSLDDKLTHAKADAISPAIAFFGSTPPLIWYAGGRLDWSRGIRNIHDHFGESLDVVGSEDFETEFCPACCMMFDASVFDRIGFLYDPYFVYCEDVDFCWRMKLSGMRIIVSPALRMLHKASALTGGTLSDFTIRYQYRNRILFVRRFCSLPFIAYTTVMISAAIIGRKLFKGDSMAQMRLRFRAVREGFSVPSE